MSALPLLLLVAVIAGIAVAVQGELMGMLDRRLGTVTSVLVTYGLGALLAAAIWVVRKGTFEKARELPWYAWTAGGFGLVIVGGIGYAAPRLGLSRTLVVTVAAQLIAALVIDYFAHGRAVDAWRVAGVALTIAGAWLIVKQ